MGDLLRRQRAAAKPRSVQGVCALHSNARRSCLFGRHVFLPVELAAKQENLSGDLAQGLAEKD